MPNNNSPGSEAFIELVLSSHCDLVPGQDPFKKQAHHQTVRLVQCLQESLLSVRLVAEECPKDQSLFVVKPDSLSAELAFDCALFLASGQGNFMNWRRFACHAMVSEAKGWQAVISGLAASNFGQAAEYLAALETLKPLFKPEKYAFFADGETNRIVLEGDWLGSDAIALDLLKAQPAAEGIIVHLRPEAPDQLVIINQSLKVKSFRLGGIFVLKAAADSVARRPLPAVG